MAYYRSDQALVHVAVQGVKLDNEPWDVFEGGERKSAGLKVYPGGMREQVELGGTPEREPVKVQRKWSDALIGVFKELDAVVGEAPAEVSITTLNDAKQPVGSPIVYKGILLGVTRPHYKAGPSEEILLELTIGTHGALG